MNCILKADNSNEVIKEIWATLKEHGINEIPYYACHEIAEGKIRCIEGGKIEIYSGTTEKDLVYFLFCLKKELTNGFVVSFDWGDDPIRKEVVMLPNTNFRGCFDTKGTWMHIRYDIEKQTYTAFCNIVRYGDTERTKRDMKNIAVKRLALSL